MKATQVFLFTIIFLFVNACPVNSQTTTAKSLSPIKMTNVPLVTAIGILAREADIDYILSPRLSDPNLNSGGKIAPKPVVTFFYTNLTAGQVLVRLLKEHGLVMVKNPANPIVEIGSTNRIKNPMADSWLDSGTNQIVPIVFQAVPLDLALKFLIKKSNLNAIVDKKISGYFDPKSHSFHAAPTVSVRWKRATPEQGIVALCENYDLEIAEDSSGAFKIKWRE